MTQEKINLNDKEFITRVLANKRLLLEHIDPIDVYLSYMGEVDGSLKSMMSPLRAKPEKNASFGLFEGESGELCFKDFTLNKGGDFIDFVQTKYNLNYYDAMSKIIVDFDLTRWFLYRKNTEKTELKPISDEDKEFVEKIRNKKRIGIKSTPFTMQDIAFWRQFGISKATLEKYKVKKPEYIFIIGKNGEHVINAKPFTYAFEENKDGRPSYKIYRPYDKKEKWYNNHDASVWQGWEQLPERGDKLIITKSLKDVMAITEITGIPAVSLQSESVAPKLNVMDELKERFTYIYVLYDNDYDSETNWGREFAMNLVECFDLFHIEIHKDWKSKDFSDLIKAHGATKGREIIKLLINDIVPF